MTKERHHAQNLRRLQERARERFRSNLLRERMARRAGYGHPEFEAGFWGPFRVLGLWLRGGPRSLIVDSIHTMAAYVLQCLHITKLFAVRYIRQRLLPRLGAMISLGLAACLFGLVYEAGTLPAEQMATRNVGRIEGLLFPAVAFNKPNYVKPSPAPSESPAFATGPTPHAEFRFALNVATATITRKATRYADAQGESSTHAAEKCPFILTDETARQNYGLPQGKTEYRIEKAVFVRDAEEANDTDQAVQPLSLALVFDQSGSIFGNDPDNRRVPAAISLIDKLPSTMRARIYSYPAQESLYSGTSLSTPLISLFNGKSLAQPGEPVTNEGGICLAHTQFTNDKGRLSTAIKTLANRSNGPINQLYDSTLIGIDHLKSEAAGRRLILINFSDGDDIGSRYGEADVIREAKAANVAIYFVALGNGVNTSRMEPMANATGGMVVSAQNGDNLARAFDGITKKIRSAETIHGHWELVVRARRDAGRAFTPETLHFSTEGNSVPPQSFAVGVDPARVTYVP